MNKQFQKLASQIAKLEGKKKQVSIGNIREVLSCLIKIDARHRLYHSRLGITPLGQLALLSNKEFAKMFRARK